MSAFLEKVHALLDEAKAEVEKLFGHGDAEVQAVTKAAAEKIDAVKAAVETDLPEVEHEAVADAEKVAADAESAAKPVVAEAVKAAETVGAEAAADVAKDACPAQGPKPQPVETGRRVIITWPAPTTAGVLPIFSVTLTDADSGEQIVTAVKLALTLGTDTGFEGSIIEAEVTALVNADGQILRAGEPVVPSEDGEWLNTKVFRFAVAEMRVADQRPASPADGGC